MVTPTKTKTTSTTQPQEAITMTTTAPTDIQFEGLVPGTWTIDPSHSEVGFTVRHLMSKVRGLFTSFEGELRISDNPLESSARATIDLSSVDTRNTDRDN